MFIKKVVIGSALLSALLSPNFLSAKSFNLEKTVKKCQKCHGENFEKKVLHATRQIGLFSKSELLEVFDKYDNAPDGGRKGLMKIILKKYNAQQRSQIADFIVNKNK
ncbi:hypothetical protein HUE87_04535 [Candidatus Sulfurimonas marisnigri]|uniref:Cytochrome c domain-containing protein n=1 Tax=Candidatus Sulfurimonas marisnigri TaxID=2740405 RepID=A0A7S7M1P2_9BACT|nr:hypothetical protein [Candidatus Sulfurimonas marisnigri]QOY55506.1 hypothetical protein HUE87_04535 [Candidatus Sulfurimonas marisnigri]